MVAAQISAAQRAVNAARRRHVPQRRQLRRARVRLAHWQGQGERAAADAAALAHAAPSRDSQRRRLGHHQESDHRPRARVLPDESSSARRDSCDGSGARTGPCTYEEKAALILSDAQSRSRAHCSDGECTDPDDSKQARRGVCGRSSSADDGVLFELGEERRQAPLSRGRLG